MRPPSRRAKKKEISQADYDKYTQSVAILARTQLSRQVNRAISSLPEELNKAYGDTTDQEDEQFARELLTTLLPLVLIYGVLQNNQGKQLLLTSGLSTEAVRDFRLSPTQTKSYQDYLDKIARYFNEQTAQSIRNVVARGQIS